MHRLFVAVLLIVTALQGPALSYAVTVGSSSDAAVRTCSSYTLSDGKDCDTCCTQGSMPACAAQCPVPVGAAIQAAPPMMIRMVSQSAIVPDVDVAPFADHSPPHPLRPPIV